MEINKIYHGDALEVLKTFPNEWVNCVVTSPPYWGLRDYGEDGQLGLEKTPEEYVDKLVGTFREIRRVLKKDGTVWLNLGDTYARDGLKKQIKQGHAGIHENLTAREALNQRQLPIGLKEKDLVGIPWRTAFALQKDGWWLRQDIIWHKPNPMPESVTDRCTKAHEYIFLLTKSAKYYYDAESIAEKSEWVEKDNRSKTGYIQSGVGVGIYDCDKQGVYRDDGLRNKRSVWTVNTGHFRKHILPFIHRNLLAPAYLLDVRKTG